MQYNRQHLRSNSGGFSLIELMIVVTIMGMLASIVLPESFNMLEQHQANLEQKKLVDFFKDQKYKAYLLETEIVIELAGVGVESSLGEGLTFEFITSDYQNITITELGSFNEDYIVYTLRGREVETLLGDL